MAKWVRQGKVDGKYFEEPIWHWRPDPAPRPDNAADRGVIGI